MEIDLMQSSFIKHLNNLSRKIINDTFNEKQPFEQSRPYRADEDYVVSVLLAASEIITLCIQIDQATFYLKYFRNTPQLKKAGINRYKHILYNLENHLIRTQSLFDRLLVLVNNTYRIGNPPKNCREHVILSNTYLQGTKVLKLLNELNKIMNATRGERNRIIHHKSYNDEELRRLELYYLLGEETDLKLDAGWVVKNYLLIKTKELKKFNDYLFGMVLNIFSELEIVFKKTYPFLAQSL